MYKLIPFEDIDKNKWNGSVHYSLNGNVYGYYWYLKAVLNEWDAVIEDDYESVFPIITKPLYEEQYQVLPFLGPYSVNFMNHSRFNSFFETTSAKNKSAFYPLNQQIPKNIIDSIPSQSFPYWKLETKSQYNLLRKKFSEEVISFLDEKGLTGTKLSAGIKPETIVETKNDSAILKNTYLRLMYNAMHRGIGFSNAIFDHKSDEILAVNFYLMSHNNFYELYQYSIADEYRWVLIDLLIQNQAGKPMHIYTFNQDKSDDMLGFEKMTAFHHQIDHSWMHRIRKKIGLTY